MRYFGNRATPSILVSPDTRLSLLLTAGSGQAFDYPAGTDVVRLSVGSTIASLFGPVFFAPASTGAALPTTGGVVTTGDSSGGIPLMGSSPYTFQRPRGSTGFSLISGSSFSVCAEFWSRAG